MRWLHEKNRVEIFNLNVTGMKNIWNCTRIEEAIVSIIYNVKRENSIPQAFKNDHPQQKAKPSTAAITVTFIMTHRMQCKKLQKKNKENNE